MIDLGNAPNQRNSDAEAPLLFLSKSVTQIRPPSGSPVSILLFRSAGRTLHLHSGNMVRAASSMVRWHGLTFLGVRNENTNLAGDQFDFGSMLELIYQF
jgi:hypothetical protein